MENKYIYLVVEYFGMYDNKRMDIICAFDNREDAENLREGIEESADYTREESFYYIGILKTEFLKPYTEDKKCADCDRYYQNNNGSGDCGKFNVHRNLDACCINCIRRKIHES